MKYLVIFSKFASLAIFTVIMFTSLFIVISTDANGAVIEKPNRSLELNGTSDYVKIPNSSSLNITSKITLMAWVKPKVLNHWGGIVCKGDDVANHQDYTLWFNAGKVQMSFNWPELTVTSKGPNVGATTVPLNVWSHFTGTWDGKQVKLYVNGKLDSTFDWKGPIKNSNANLFIGLDPAGGDEYFNGYIDEVAIYNRVLTAEEIELAMNQMHAGNELGLVGCWNFDDGTANDLTVNHNHGQLMGRAKIVESDLFLKAIAPIISVNPTTLDFGDTEINKTFNIINRGNGVLSWAIDESMPIWIKSIVPMNGEIPAGRSSSISLNINRQGLPVGLYTFTIPISSNGGNATVSIMMKVPSAPVLSVVPNSLNFGTTPTMSSILVSNEGGGTLNWKASKTQSWLSIVQTSGSLTEGKSQSVNVTVNRTGLKPGSYSDTISFTSNGGNANVSVSMTVPEPDPKLSYTPSSLDFGTNKDQLELKITNSGGKTLNWQLTKEQNWLSPTPTNGSLAGGDSQNVIVAVNRADQNPGTYQGKISITSNGGSGSVDVTMTVIELIPALAFAPANLNFETADSQKVFTITNNGNGKLNWLLATQSNWLFLSQTTGTLNPSSSININVSVNKAIIKPGEWTDEISINSNGGNGIIKASLKVPGLSYTPKSINLGVSTTKSIIEITNIGAGILNWQASKKQTWITINPSEGSLETGMLVGLIITISRDGLKPGDYSDTITITTNAGIANIPIIMSVPEPPAVMSFDPNFLDFGTSDTEKTFTITNKGLGTLTWQASRQQSWVTLSPLVGALEANKSVTITVKVSRANLSPGSYKDTISISSNGGAASISVTMMIPEPILPQAKLSVSSIKAKPNSQINIQLILTNGSGVAGGNIRVNYNSNILEVGEIKGTEMASGMSVFANASVLGQIQIAMAGTTAISFGSGALINISFTISSNAVAGTETLIELVDTELYNELGITIPTKLENGSVKIEPICIKGDVNGDGEIKSNDAMLILRIAAGLLEPDEYQKCSADVNDDGQVKANDAMLVLRRVAGLIAPAKEYNTGNHITVSLPQSYGVKGQLISIPIITDNFDNLACGDISIIYDSRILNAKSVAFATNILMASDINKSGIIKISFTCIDKLSSNNLCEIKFEVLADDISPIAFENAELYNFDAMPLKSKLFSNQFISYNVKPKQNMLLQNYPNPFNPQTWIPYQLSEASEVVIRIYDVSGKVIRELKLGYKPAGIYTSRDRSAYWDGKNDFGEFVSSGVYFYTIQAGKYISTRKMVVAR